MYHGHQYLFSDRMGTYSTGLLPFDLHDLNSFWINRCAVSRQLSTNLDFHQIPTSFQNALILDYSGICLKSCFYFVLQVVCCWTKFWWTSIQVFSADLFIYLVVIPRVPRFVHCLNLSSHMIYFCWYYDNLAYHTHHASTVYLMTHIKNTSVCANHPNCIYLDSQTVSATSTRAYY